MTCFLSINKHGQGDLLFYAGPVVKRAERSVKALGIEMDALIFTFVIIIRDILH